MSRITVVIESHTEGVHLGMELAGGRVVAAMEGDHSDCLEALESSQMALAGYTHTNAITEAAMGKAEAAIAKARSTP